MPEIVNAVGGSDLNQEVDLDELYEAISGDEIRYDPEYWPGLYVRFTSDSPAILVFRTGKYNIAGADSIADLFSSNDTFISRIHELGIGEKCSELEIRNLVFLDRYRKELDLDQIVIALGLENAEYEPEQFPGVLYKSDDVKGTFLIFRNGKIILTGAVEEAAAGSAFNDLFNKLDALFR